MRVGRMSLPPWVSRWMRSPSRKILTGTGGSFTLAGLGLPFLSTDESTYDTASSEALDEAYRNRVELTPGQRLRLMYRWDEDGTVSPELHGVIHTSTVALITSSVIGGQAAGAEAYKRYMVEARNKMFENPRFAQMEMADRLRMAVWKGGLKYARKVTGLTFVYTLTATTFCVARNDVTPLEHATAGFLTGAGWRVIQGPKAMLGSGLVGLAFGAVAGGVLMGLNWVNGETEEERWKRNYFKEKKLLESDLERRRFKRDNTPDEGTDNAFSDRMWEMRRKIRRKIGLSVPDVPEDFEDKTKAKLDGLGKTESQAETSTK